MRHRPFFYAPNNLECRRDEKFHRGRDFGRDSGDLGRDSSAPSERCGCTRHDRVRTTSDGDEACDPNSSSAGLHGLRAAVTPIRLAHSATPAHPDARKTDQQENTG